MRILFLHPSFPAQFRYLAPEFAQAGHEVIFLTARSAGQLSGVRKVLYQRSRQVNSHTHRYVQSLEQSVLHGQAVFRAAQALKQEGFIPDVIYGHAGSGVMLFMQDLFPHAELVGYFEWFYRAHGSDADFDPAEPLTVDDEARIRLLNASILLDLTQCDRCICPTHWQKAQFPPEYANKLTVVPDSIDTDFFCPRPNAPMVLPSCNLDLSHTSEVITYVVRGFEPYRGFPQFMTALSLIQAQRPQCHAVIVGEDRVVYGRSHPSGKTYQQVMLDKLDLDLSRIHFVGIPPWNDYRTVFQASNVHVHLCRPFLLSWSLREAIACGCAIVASNTPPVLEVFDDVQNGALVDFFDVGALVFEIVQLLDRGRS
ncbi:MAG: glycosyltransferase [Elainellaceae cyanobacterium]